MITLFAALALALPALQPIAIEHVSVINVESGKVQKDVSVLLEDGVIRKVARKVQVDRAQVVDGTGKFLIPGLWDMHVHCCNADDHFFALFLANGVTGIRDMFGPMEELKTLRSNVETGTVLGPRMMFSGPIVDGPKPMWSGSIAVSTPEEGRKAVETIQKDGGDFVKVYSLLPRDAYFAIADEAKKRHMVFAGHVPYKITAVEASNAGQKSFEHLICVPIGCSSREAELRAQKDQLNISRIKTVVESYDEKKAETLFSLFRKNGTWQCPTLTVMNVFQHFDAPVFLKDPRLQYLPRHTVAEWSDTNYFKMTNMTHEDWEIMHMGFDEMLMVVGKMEKAGVGILAGTDTPNPGAFPGFGIHDELAFLVKSGMTPLQALQAATINPARYFGWQKTMGTVQAGKVADLVLLDANPLVDIHNTTNINAVFLRGKYLDKDELGQMLSSSSGSK